MDDRATTGRMKSVRILLLTALGLLQVGTMLQGCAAPAPADGVEFQRWLVPYLQSQHRELQPYVSRSHINYGYALSDLNGDGVNEAVVYVTGDMCGTGGCGLEVLARDGARWRLISSTAIGYAPIQVLPTKTDGWRDLGVYSRLNATHGHQARLRFSGRGYEENPVAPDTAPTASSRAVEHVVIADANIPLFPT